MPAFAYKARKNDGSTQSGSIEAGDRKQATRLLRARGLTPLSISEESGSGGGGALDRYFPWLAQLFAKSAPAAEAPGSTSGAQKGGRSAGREKIGLQLLNRLKELHASGLPIGDAIRILSQRLHEPQLKTLANDLWRDLSEGLTFAEALGRKPQYFAESITHVIRAGEATGNLGPVLKKVTDYLEERAALRSKMVASLAYPGFICAVAVAVVVFFLTVLLPQIENMLARLGGEMTFSAKLLIDGSDALIRFGPYLAILFGLTLFGLARWRKSSKGRQETDRWLLRVPFFNTIAINSNLFQAGSLISTLLESGINTTEALLLTEQTIQNRTLRDRFHRARTQVNEGVSISAAFRKNQFMPDIALDVLAVGEDTGNLSHSMEEITRGFRERLSAQLARLITFVSTGALMFAFALVGLVAVGIVTSIFQVSRSISG